MDQNIFVSTAEVAERINNDCWYLCINLFVCDQLNWNVWFSSTKYFCHIWVLIVNIKQNAQLSLTRYISSTFEFSRICGHYKEAVSQPIKGFSELGGYPWAGATKFLGIKPPSAWLASIYPTEGWNFILKYSKTTSISNIHLFLITNVSNLKSIHPPSNHDIKVSLVSTVFWNWETF